MSIGSSKGCKRPTDRPFGSLGIYAPRSANSMEIHKKNWESMRIADTANHNEHDDTLNTLTARSLGGTKFPH